MYRESEIHIQLDMAPNAMIPTLRQNKMTALIFFSAANQADNET
jgi:hypothetical protein